MRFPLAVFALLLFAAAGPAETIKVPGDYGKIQEAIDGAKDGDLVLVDPGTYGENIDFLGKAVTVMSAKGPGVTCIDGGQAGSVVVFHGKEGPGSVLDGFTVTNGSGIPFLPGYYGGGIFCWNASSPVIRNNIVTENQADLGAGIECLGASPELTNNIIAWNSATAKGGGIEFLGAQTSLANNTLFGNTAGLEGGGIYAVDSELTVRNTILWNNIAPAGPEARIGFSLGPANLSILYSDVKGGQNAFSIDPCCTLSWGTGMIDEAPLLKDPANGDYRLDRGSPCINRGTNTGAPAQDFEGDPRPFMGRAEIGADEFTGLHRLEADNFVIPGSSGGAVHFLLDAGAANKGRSYLILGTLSGTSPGQVLPEAKKILPINWDSFTDVTADMNLAEDLIFINFFGKLDSSGKSSALFDTNGPVPSALGLETSFAYALEGPPWDFASNPVTVEIIN